MSPEEQKDRLRERLERPDKYWKYNPGDVDERAKWPRTWRRTRRVLDRTSTEHAPWYVVPADHKWYARLAVGAAAARRVEGLHLRLAAGRLRRRGGEGAGWTPSRSDVARRDDFGASSLFWHNGSLVCGSPAPIARPDPETSTRGEVS